jgi:NAD(P)-dependent dehydrogenase (short-subunit alcohol dehydrogenase family)
MPEERHETSVGIVTGAGSGMGLECASRLAAMVDLLILADVNEGAVTDTTKKLSERDRWAEVVAVPLDVTDAEALAGLAARVAATGSLRGVAHAAGISPTMADWRTVLTVDLVGTAMLMEALLPLSGAGTAIVCYASLAPHLSQDPVDPAIDAVLDDPLHPDFLDRIRDVVGPTIEDSGLAYFWAKRGVLTLAHREAIRFGQRGARVCSVSPGIIDTPMGRQESASNPILETFAAMTPLGRQGLADEVAAVTAFLLSDDASFVNGIDVLVDGGALAAIRRSQGAPPSE